MQFSDGSDLVLLNAHNFDFSQQDRGIVRDFIRHTLRSHSSLPTCASLLVAGGDWNYTSPACPTLSASTTDGQCYTTPPSITRRDSTMTNDLVEIAQPDPTHFTARHTSPEHNMYRESQLDRYYIGASAICMSQLVFKCATSQADFVLRNDLSDHIPVLLHIKPRPTTPRQQRPIPDWITRHPIFRRDAADRLQRLESSPLSATDMWRRAKQALHSAAAFTLRQVMSRPADSAQARRQACLQLARAITRNDPGATAQALRALPDAAAFVQITDSLDIIVSAQAQLDLLFRRIMQEAVRQDDQRDAGERHTAPKQHPRRHRTSRRPVLDALSKL